MSEVMERLFLDAKIRVDLGPARIRLSQPWLIPWTFLHECAHGAVYWLFYREPFYVGSTVMLGTRGFPKTFDEGFTPISPVSVIGWEHAVICSVGPLANAVQGLLFIGIWAQCLTSAANLLQLTLGAIVMGFWMSHLLMALANILPFPLGGEITDGMKVRAFLTRTPIQAPVGLLAFSDEVERVKSASSDPAEINRMAGKLLMDAYWESVQRESDRLAPFDRLLARFHERLAAAVEEP